MKPKLGPILGRVTSKFRVGGPVHKPKNENMSFPSHRSSAGRDFIGPYKSCDTSWLGQEPCNPLAVGQYVNNQSRNKPANVAYQELDVPLCDLPLNHLRFIPNVWYGAGNISHDNAFIRTVALVSVQQIQEGEELFSSYFTVVH